MFCRCFSIIVAWVMLLSQPCQQLSADSTPNDDYPNLFRHPRDVAKRSELVLDDGSVWEVRDRDQDKISDWQSSDYIRIDNKTPMKPFHYFLKNLNLNQRIQVNLIESFETDNECYTYIVGFDRDNITLSNGVRFHLGIGFSGAGPEENISNWNEGDPVIVGWVPDFITWGYNYILIHGKRGTHFAGYIL